MIKYMDNQGNVAYVQFINEAKEIIDYKINDSNEVIRQAWIEFRKRFKTILK